MCYFRLFIHFLFVINSLLLSLNIPPVSAMVFSKEPVIFQENVGASFVTTSFLNRQRQAGYAVLIQGRAPNGEGADSYNKTVQRVHAAFRQRNFSDQNIFYFGYGLHNGIDSNSSRPQLTNNTIDFNLDQVGKAKIQQQIQQLYRQMNNNPAPLYIVMIGHGTINADGNAMFLSNARDGDVLISADELDGWLDTLEARLTGAAQKQPRIIVSGFCYSGGFIERLAGANGTALTVPRVVISSTSANEISYRGAQEKDGVRPGEYFVESLFRLLVQGQTIGQAFSMAKQDTFLFSQQLIGSGQHLFSTAQHPQISTLDQTLILGLGQPWKNFNSDLKEPPQLVTKLETADIAQPSQDFAAIFPPSGSTVHINATIFQWESAIGVRKDLTYRLSLCEDVAMSSNCRVFEQINVPFKAVMGLADLTTYFWQIDGIDAFGAATILTRQNSIDVALDSNNVVGVVKGFVQSGLDFSILSGHSVERIDGLASDPYLAALTDPATGYYELLTLSGSVAIEASAAGYQSTSANVNIPASCSELQILLGQCLPEPVQYNFQLAEALSDNDVNVPLPTWMLFVLAVLLMQAAVVIRNKS